MPTYLNTLGEASLAIGVCGRCQNKRKIAELVSDPNSPGLRVCIYGCVDDYDPWRLPARANDKLDILYPRPEEPLTTPNDALNDPANWNDNTA